MNVPVHNRNAMCTNLRCGWAPRRNGWLMLNSSVVASCFSSPPHFSSAMHFLWRQCVAVFLSLSAFILTIFFLLLACWRIMLDTFYSQLVASFLFTVHLLRSTALCIGIIWHVVYATPKWKRLWEKHHLRHSSKKKLTPLLVPHLPPLLLLVLYLDSCCSILFGPIHPIHFLLFTITWCVECYWRQVIY